MLDLIARLGGWVYCYVGARSDRNAYYGFGGAAWVGSL